MANYDGFMDFLKDPDKSEFPIEGTSYIKSYLKVPFANGYQIILQVKQCPKMNTPFLHSSFDPIGILTSTGEIAAVDYGYYFDYLPFPEGCKTFNDVRNDISIDVIHEVLPDILREQKAFLPEDINGFISGNSSEYLTKFDLSKPFEQNVDLIRHTKENQISITDIYLKLIGQYDTKAQAEKIKAKLAAKDEALFAGEDIFGGLLRKVCYLKHDYDLAKSIVGLNQQKTIEVVKQIKDNIPKNARSGSIVFIGKSGNEITIQVNMQAAFSHNSKCKFWIGAVCYTSYQDQITSYIEEGAVSLWRRNSCIIPWNKIKRVIHRRKTIFEQ